MNTLYLFSLVAMFGLYALIELSNGNPVPNEKQDSDSIETDKRGLAFLAKSNSMPKNFASAISAPYSNKNAGHYSRFGRGWPYDWSHLRKTRLETGEEAADLNEKMEQ